QLIMDIFAQRAATKEARLQVELAQLRYLLPRLRGWGSALTRLGGGIGTRGPGETQLELDRKKINRRIHTLERRLKKARSERALRSHKRRSGPFPLIALIGYTNSGKSTLLNRLCAADVLVEDNLFATLTTTIRRGETARGQLALFADTVGFIRNLPHHLIPAFAATLETVRDADLLLHVIDSSRPSCSDDYQSVITTLDHEVFTSDEPRPPVIDVLNKIDLIPADEIKTEAFHKPVLISARKGTNMDGLLARVRSILSQGKRAVSLILPYNMMQEVHSLSRREKLRVCGYTKEGVEVEATLPEEDLMRLLRQGGRISPSDSVPQKQV
ncbi:MAG TPA: GTPase HflX, partial [Candidatus Acetothermia bacterium]|nr:GTPase HflX [Candidatus Acetothermia bacterium]